MASEPTSIDVFDTADGFFGLLKQAWDDGDADRFASLFAEQAIYVVWLGFALIGAPPSRTDIANSSAGTAAPEWPSDCWALRCCAPMPSSSPRWVVSVAANGRFTTRFRRSLCAAAQRLGSVSLSRTHTWTTRPEKRSMREHAGDAKAAVGIAVPRPQNLHARAGTLP
jgi:hypothetical protein